MSDREGKILRDRRLELGFTQEQVALELGMNTHQYQRYEYGEILHVQDDNGGNLIHMIMEPGEAI